MEPLKNISDSCETLVDSESIDLSCGERIDKAPNQTFAHSVSIDENNIITDPSSKPDNCSIGSMPFRMRMPSVLTFEEEERIAIILNQNETDVEKYACLSSMDEARESVIDEHLRGLGYDFYGICDHTGRHSDEAKESGTVIRGDKVIREMARERQDLIKEKNIDKALRVVLHDPLPPVIRIPKDEIIPERIGEVSNSICDETIATMPLTEEDIQLLLQKVAESECNLPLADRESIRNLASSIMVDESSKIENQHTCQPNGDNKSF